MRRMIRYRLVAKGKVPTLREIDELDQLHHGQVHTLRAGFFQNAVRDCPGIIAQTNGSHKGAFVPHSFSYYIVWKREKESLAVKLFSAPPISRGSAANTPSRPG